MSYAKRSDIPEKYKWNLGDIYPTPADWEKEFDEFAAEYPTACLNFSNCPTRWS